LLPRIIMLAFGLTSSFSNISAENRVSRLHRK
jgi:hypothetical protein